MSITEIRDEALRLDEEDRAELVASILESLDGADPNDSDEDSLAEARRRGEELASGDVKGLSEEECLADIRSSRNR